MNFIKRLRGMEFSGENDIDLQSCSQEQDTRSMTDQIQTPTEEQHPSGGISLFVAVPSGQTIHIDLSTDAILSDIFHCKEFDDEPTFNLLFQGDELIERYQPYETLADLGICPKSTLDTKETFMFTFKQVDGPDGVSRDQLVRSNNKERWWSEEEESIPEEVRSALEEGKTIARMWKEEESNYAWGYYDENKFVRVWVDTEDDPYPEEEYRSYTESDYERRDNEWHEHYDEECAEDSRWYTDSDYEDRYYDDRNY